MSDLHEKHAFNRVLDLLVESVKEGAVYNLLHRRADDNIDSLQRDLNNARSDLTSTKLKLETFEKGEVAFVKLYDAAEDAVGIMLAANPSCQSTGAAADLLSRAEALRAAVIAAKKFIDPIPF